MTYRDGITAVLDISTLIYNGAAAENRNTTYIAKGGKLSHNTAALIPGGDGVIDLSQALTGYPVYQNRTGSIEFIVMNDFKPWHMAYSDIMDYLHGQTMRAILEDDPEYFYEGRFTVNAWKSEKDWSRLVIDYDVGPYKWKNLSSIDNWLVYFFCNPASVLSDAATVKQMKEEGRFDDYRNSIAYTGSNMIILVQITRPLKEAHKHIPDAVLFVALGFVFQSVDRNKGSPLYCTSLLVHFKRKCSCCQIESMSIQTRFLLEIILHSHKSFACCRLKLRFVNELYRIR